MTCMICDKSKIGDVMVVEYWGWCNYCDNRYVVEKKLKWIKDIEDEYDVSHLMKIIGNPDTCPSCSGKFKFVEFKCRSKINNSVFTKKTETVPNTY